MRDDEFSDLRVQLEYHPSGAVVLAVGGAIDMNSAPLLQEAMIAAVQGRSGPGCRAILDLGAVDFLNASGVTALIGAHRHAVGRDIQWHLCRLRPAVSRVIHISGLHRVMPIHGDLRAALVAAASAT